MTAESSLIHVRVMYNLVRHWPWPVAILSRELLCYWSGGIYSDQSRSNRCVNSKHLEWGRLRISGYPETYTK